MSYGYFEHDEDDNPRPHPEGEGIIIPLHEFSAYFKNQQQLLTQQRKEREANLKAADKILSTILKKIRQEEKRNKKEEFKAMTEDENYFQHRFSKVNRFRKIHTR